MQWQITPATITIGVKGASGTVTYNGSEQSVSGYTASITSTSKFTIDTSKVTPTSSQVVASGTNASTTAYTNKYIDVNNNVVEIDSDTFAYSDHNFNATFV